METSLLVAFAAGMQVLVLSLVQSWLAARTRVQLAAVLEQGNKIHLLVNSEMTAARMNERDQTKLTLLALKRVQALSEKLGMTTTEDDRQAIAYAEERIVKLDKILAERLAAQQQIDGHE